MASHAVSDSGVTPTSHRSRTYTTHTINRAFNDFLRLQDIDRGLLARYRAALSRGGERFAKLFYDYLLASPATAEVLRRFQERGGRIENLVRRQTEHFFSPSTISAPAIPRWPCSGNFRCTR
jgi:hypothetical protein